MQNTNDIPLCRVDCGPLNDIECLACKEAQPDPVYIYCQRCIHRGLSNLENRANPMPTPQPEMQALKHALGKRKAQFITEQASLERNDCAPLGTINCLACNRPQQHPIYVYCQDCQGAAGRTATRSVDLELQLLKEVLMRRRSQVNA